jgi:UDP-glucose 4-epimerase
VAALSQAGYRIRTFSADAQTAGMFPESVEVLIGDVTDGAAVQVAMQGVDSIVHMAALLHIEDSPLDMREKYEHINVGGTAMVIEAAISKGVKRIVFFSTIAVYGPSDGRVLNETSPTRPDTIYARTKLAAEKIVLDAKNADGIPVGVVLRLAAVYGSRIKGNYERLIRALARNRFIPVGDGRNRRTLVYDKDVGRAAVLAVSHPVTADRIFNVTDGGSHTLNEIIESICLSVGRKPPRLSLPAGPTRKVIGLIEKGSYAIGFKPLVTRAVIDKYIEDIDVDGCLIQKKLHFMPKYDLKTGWEETIEEMRGRGEL